MANANIIRTENAVRNGLKSVRLVLAVLASLTALTHFLHAQVPQIISYQGRVAVDGVNFNSPPAGNFRFALVNSAGNVTYWSNDGTSTNGGAPATAVAITVTNGLYSVLLGDTTIPNMTGIPSTVFANSDVRLRVWFDDSSSGIQRLNPDQRVAAVGYAMVAGNVADGTITSAKIAPGAVGSAQLAPNAVTAANIAPGAVTFGNLFTGVAPSDGQVLSFNGSALNWVTPGGGGGGSLTLPYSQNGTSGGPLFSVNNSSIGGGLSGVSSGGTGVYGSSLTGNAALFDGSVSVNGPLTMNGEFLTVTGLGNEQAYLGGDGTSSDIQIGSLNSAVTTVSAYNAATGLFMDFNCNALHIRGGSDLAEPFPMSAPAIPQGSVVVIDDQNAGHLKRSDRPYDRRVAGIVSGANGVHPGIALQQDGVLDGGQNVALSGRVYVLADATEGPIQPGDLLTTSATPGHAMRVTDPARAQGAVLGKAMTPLAEGRGMVLVLVTLQ